MPERTVVVRDKLGLHARASAQVASTASRFRADVQLVKDGVAVNGKSIMGIMMLAAARGTKLTIRTSGDDAEHALQAIAELIEHRCGEDE